MSAVLACDFPVLIEAMELRDEVLQKKIRSPILALAIRMNKAQPARTKEVMF